MTRHRERKSKPSHARERARLASGLVLVPGDDGSLLQNFGDLPVVNVSLHVKGHEGVFVGTLAPCHEIDITPYGLMYEGQDPDGDGVMEGGRDVIIQYQDAAGRFWWREGLAGNAKSIRGSMSAPHEGRSSRAGGAAQADPLPKPRKIDGCK